MEDNYHAQVVIVNYGVGNLSSIGNMLKKSGVIARISHEPAEIAQAERILLPGMGHFDNCMERLNASGLRPVLEKRILEEKVPVLGICVGLQMLMDSSEEGKQAGLGWIKGKTIRFDPRRMKDIQKIPNMGWLETEIRRPSQLMEGLQDARFYFAHSFHVAVDATAHEIVAAHYGYDFTAGIESENISGVQFHPEKSHRFGMRLLKNFASVGTLIKPNS